MKPRGGADSHLDIFNILQAKWSMWSMYEMTCGYLWWNDAFCEFKLINVKRLCAFDFSLDGCGQLDRSFKHRRERPTEQYIVLSVGTPAAIITPICGMYSCIVDQHNDGRFVDIICPP